MDTLKNWMMTSRTFAIALGIVISFAIITIIALGIVVGRNTYMNMRLSTICPDYFSKEYAYIVDENGKGIDSVAVELWDNSNFNLIYRTFTDSCGRFVLFHDFGSFALHSIPFSYFLDVSVDGWNDTIRYMFERYRTCHFRKTDGPDTIVCRSDRRSKMVISINGRVRDAHNVGLSWIPFTDVALSTSRPRGLADSLMARNCYYTSITIGSKKVPCAIIPVKEFQIPYGNQEHLAEGLWYVLDHNGDMHLSDETPRMITGESGSSADCFMGTCMFTDSVSVGERNVSLECRVTGANEKNPVLGYRRHDALYGTVTLDSATYTVSIWDAGATLFSDRSRVVLMADRNGDSTYTAADGSAEVFGNVLGTISIGRYRFLIDTIDNDGLHLYCSNIYHDTVAVKRSTAAIGTWVDEFKGVVVSPFSLYQTCASHSYVMFYFFEGNSWRMMHQPAIVALTDLMKEELGSVALIGVNRYAAGSDVCSDPVIVENRGWRGPLVEQLHNTLPEELVCLDAAATIVYRGAPGTAAISALWKHAGKDDEVAKTLYGQQVVKPVVDLP